MANIYTTNVIHNGTRRYIAQFLNQSDGTEEIDTRKVRLQDLIGPDGVNPPTKFSIQEVQWDIQGMNAVYVDFNTLSGAVVDSRALLLAEGQGYKTFVSAGGLHDPKADGAGGDISLTTNGATNNSTYDIIIDIRLHG